MRTVRKIIVTALILSIIGCHRHNSVCWVTELINESDRHLAFSDCLGSDQATETSQLALSALAVQLVGYRGLDAAKIRQALTWRPIGICLVPEPEPCCYAGVCSGPCTTINGSVRCARKSGCSTERHVWVSLTWPMMCDESWPDEPHCVISSKNELCIENPNCYEILSRYNWRNTLVHELSNVVHLRLWSGIPDYKSEYYTSISRRVIDLVDSLKK